MEEAEKQVHQLTQDSYDVAWVVGQIALRKVVEQIQFWRDSDADQYGPEFFISYYDPKDGMTPNCKADVLTCILRFVAIELDSIDRKAIPFEEVLGHVMRRSSGKEQDVAHEVRQAVFLLARTGLVVVDTYDWSRKTMTISAGTVVKKSPLLHEFVYGEDDAEAVE
jgi:hypothetical protein